MRSERRVHRGGEQCLSRCRLLLLNRTLSLALCKTVRVTIEMNLKLATGLFLDLAAG